MRPIASDTSLILPALLSPAGQRRKLLVLLAYRGLNYYTRVGLDELQLLRQEAERAGADIGGLAIEALVERANHRKAALAEHLPPLAPDDLMLVASPALLDEVEAKIAAKGPKILKERWTDNAPAMYRRKLAELCGIITASFDLTTVPAHTEGRDRKDDFVIETAFRGSGLVIVSDDRKRMALSDDETIYRDPRTGQEVPACWPSTFIDRFVITSGFDINDVDGALLELAVALN